MNLMTMSSDQLFPQRFLLPRLNKKRLTLSALFYGKRGKLVGANLQLFSDPSNNLRKTIVIIFNFLTKMMASRNATPLGTKGMFLK
jgi:hypothetical protein